MGLLLENKERVKNHSTGDLESLIGKDGYLRDLPDGGRLILWAGFGPLLAQLFCTQQELVSWTSVVLFLFFLTSTSLLPLFPFIFLPPKISSWKEKNGPGKS